MQQHNPGRWFRTAIATFMNTTPPPDNVLRADALAMTAVLFWLHRHVQETLVSDSTPGAPALAQQLFRSVEFAQQKMVAARRGADGDSNVIEAARNQLDRDQLEAFVKYLEARQISWLEQERPMIPSNLPLSNCYQNLVAGLLQVAWRTSGTEKDAATAAQPAPAGGAEPVSGMRQRLRSGAFAPPPGSEWYFGEFPYDPSAPR